MLRKVLSWGETVVERWSALIAWLGLFIQFNPPDERRVWYWCWGASDTFLWTPWFKFHWRRDIWRSVNAHVKAYFT